MSGYASYLRGFEGTENMEDDDTKQLSESPRASSSAHLTVQIPEEVPQTPAQPTRRIMPQAPMKPRNPEKRRPFRRLDFEEVAKRLGETNK